MEEKFIQIDYNEKKEITNKKQELPNCKDYNHLKVKAGRIHLTAPKKKNANILNFEFIPSLQFLSLSGKKKSTSNKYKDYKIFELNEKDKKLIYCFNYLKDNIELKGKQEIFIDYLNEKTNVNIIQRTPFLLVIIDNENFVFEKCPREIMFINDEEKKIIKKFIYSNQCLKKSLVELGFNSCYVKIPKNYINESNIINDILNELDSESSEVSLEPLEIYSDKSITFIFNKNQKPILNKKNFNNKFPKNLEELNKLQDLNNNSKYYYKYDNKSFQNLNSYQKAIENFHNIKESIASKIVYLYGPNGCSKTTFLLYLINFYGFGGVNTLYFNYNYLEQKNILNKKRIIYHELLYFCNNLEEIKSIEDKKIFNGIADKKNVMELIYNLLEVLFEVIKEDKTIQRIIIIDNIYNNDNYTITYLNNIIKFIYNKSSNIKLILSGKGPYFNEKFIEFYKEFHVLTNDDNFLENQLSEFFYIYYADIIDINDIIIDEEKKENELKEEKFIKEELKRKIYSFYTLYFSEELNNKKLNYKDIIENKGFIATLPLEYFQIKINNNNEIVFQFYNDSLKKCVRNIVEYEVEKGTLTTLLKNNDYPRTFFGICFEKLITLLLKHNRLNLTNLKFNKNNIVTISEISILKEDSYSGKTFKLNKNEPILVIQENFFGPLYDLLIITKRNDKYYSDFVQIGVDKSEQQINDITKDLNLKYNIYKSNISKAFGIESDLISVLFIFDYETQRDKNFLMGFNTCRKKKINFYLFSIIDCSLIELNEKKDKKMIVNKYFPSFIIESDKKSESEKSYGQRNRVKKEKNEDKKITEYFYIDDNDN